MSYIDKIKSIFSKGSNPEEPEPTVNTLDYSILSNDTNLISADFSKEYVPSMAEDAKFLVANTDDPAYAGYPAEGLGKFAMMAHVVTDQDSVDFTQSYVPSQAENGKFVQLDLDESLGWPATNYPKYAVLTYITNLDSLVIGGGTIEGNLDLSGNDILNVGTIQTQCGSSVDWCSVYNQVNTLSSSWGGGGGTSFTFGSAGQIPYVSAGDADFQYGGISYESNTLSITGDLVIPNGDVYLQSDSDKQYYGAADDASIGYDGTDLVIDPAEVGSGSLNIKTAAPSIKVTDETDSNSAEWARSDTDGKVEHKNTAFNVGGPITNLEAHWLMNDNDANADIIDNTGNGNTGTAYAFTNTLSRSGKINNALEIVGGANNSIVLPNNASFNINESNDWTIAFWLYGDRGPGFASTEKVFYKWDGFATPGIFALFIPSTPNLRFYFRDTVPVSVTMEIQPTPTAWNHIVLTHRQSDNTARAYLNGSLANSLSLSGVGEFGNSEDFWLGVDERYAGDSSSAFDGAYDDFRVYSKELNIAEIEELYNSNNGTEDNIGPGFDAERVYLTHEDGQQQSEAGITTLGHANGSVNIDADFGINLNDNVSVSNNNITDVNEIHFNTAHTPTLSTGQLGWDMDEGTLDLGLEGDEVILQIGQEMHFRVKNQTGVDIDNGVAVQFAGTTGNSGNLLVAPMTGDGSVDSKFFMGLTTETIPNGENGYVTTFGKVRGIDTTGQGGETWNDGDVLYLSPLSGGALTNVEPDAPNNNITVAAVVHAHTNGILFVRPTFTPKLQSLQDVDGTSLTTTGQIMVWDNANGYFDADYNIEDYKTIENIETVTTTFTILASSGVVLADATSSDIDIIFPTASANTKREITVKKIDTTTNLVTLSANTNIDGSDTQIINTSYDAIKVKSDGVQWWII